MAPKISAACLLITLGVLSACGTVTGETSGSVTVDGITYPTLTREFEQDGQTVTTGSVLYANRSYGCNTLKPGDCEAVVDRLRGSDDVGRTVIGMDSSSFIIPGVN